MPLSGSVAPVIIDLFTYYSVFIKPGSSTASLALLWIPIWNTVIFLPLGLLIGFGIDKAISKKETAS